MGAILQCSGGAEKASGNPPQAWSSAWSPTVTLGQPPTPGCPFLRKEWVEREVSR